MTDPESLTAVHVSPALVVPTPVVSTEREESKAAYRKNCDLPTPGSPMRRRWGSPRSWLRQVGFMNECLFNYRDNSFTSTTSEYNNTK